MSGGGLLSGVNSLLVQAIFAAVLGMFQFGFNTGVINSPQVRIEFYFRTVCVFSLLIFSFQDVIKDFITESYRDRGNDLSSGTVSFLFSLAVSAALVSLL